MSDYLIPDPSSGGAKTGTPLDPPIALIPFWMDEPGIWDTITIAGKLLPGLCVVDGDLSRKLDKKNAKGADGATISDDGADPTDIDIRLVLATKQQWIDYQRIVPILHPAAVKEKAAPVDVSHPALALHGITSIYIEKLSFPKPGSDRQTREVTIKAVGWLPAPKAPAKSKTTTPQTPESAQEYYSKPGTPYYDSKAVDTKP